MCIVARKIGAKVVQISTDDVFDGKSDTPYNEFDVAKPKTVYGCSKKQEKTMLKNLRINILLFEVIGFMDKMVQILLMSL